MCLFLWIPCDCGSLFCCCCFFLPCLCNNRSTMLRWEWRGVTSLDYLVLVSVSEVGATSMVLSVSVYLSCRAAISILNSVQGPGWLSRQIFITNAWPSWHHYWMTEAVRKKPMLRLGRTLASPSHADLRLYPGTQPCPWPGKALAQCLCQLPAENSGPFLCGCDPQIPGISPT